MWLWVWMGILRTHISKNRDVGHPYLPAEEIPVRYW